MELASANTQNAGVYNASSHVKSGAARASSGLASPSNDKPQSSGPRRTSSNPSGASPSTSPQPMPAQALRQPCASTALPTSGNAAMKPMLNSTEYIPIARL